MYSLIYNFDQWTSKSSINTFIHEYNYDCCNIGSGAFTFTHIATYLFPINPPPSLIGPIKSKPHFIKGSSRNIVINLVKFFVFNLQILTIVTTSAKL